MWSPERAKPSDALPVFLRIMVGVATIVLSLPAAHSLKDKRRALKGRIERVRRQHGVSVAEVGDNDNIQRAQLEVACVSNQRSVLHRILTRVIDEFDTGDELIVVDAELDV